MSVSRLRGVAGFSPFSGQTYKQDDTLTDKTRGLYAGISQRARFGDGDSLQVFGPSARANALVSNRFHEGRATPVSAEVTLCKCRGQLAHLRFCCIVEGPGASYRARLCPARARAAALDSARGKAIRQSPDYGRIQRHTVIHDHAALFANVDVDRPDARLQ